MLEVSSHLLNLSPETNTSNYRLLYDYEQVLGDRFSQTEVFRNLQCSLPVTNHGTTTPSSGGTSEISDCFENIRIYKSHYSL